jgi:hypothetical protein
MRLVSKDVSHESLRESLRRRLRARGIEVSVAQTLEVEAVEPRVDPLAFNLEALAEHADVTRGLPVETHRRGLAGLAVRLAKRAFRRVGQVFINETLARQRLFNGHVRDSYAQLAAEVVRLTEQVEALQRPQRSAQRPRRARLD